MWNSTQLLFVGVIDRYRRQYGEVAQLAEHKSIMYVMQTAITFSHQEKLVVRIHPLPLPRLSVTENRLEHVRVLYRKKI